VSDEEAAEQAQAAIAAADLALSVARSELAAIAFGGKTDGAIPKILRACADILSTGSMRLHDAARKMVAAE
jgi:hypothetical protein